MVTIAFFLERRNAVRPITILQIASVNALITNYNKVIQSKIADPLSPVECVSSEDLITAYKQLNNLLGRLEIKRESFNRVIFKWQKQKYPN